MIMNIEAIKGFAENFRKVDWDKTGALDGQKVNVLDVDLTGKLSFDKPLLATVVFQVKGESEPQTLVGAFWPRDMRPESVELNGVEMPGGKVSIAGKPNWFPPGVKIKLRLRWGNGAHEFLVQGKCSVGLGLDLLKFLG